MTTTNNDFTPRDRKAFRALKFTSQIAERFGVTNTYVQYALNGKPCNFKKEKLFDVKVACKELLETIKDEEFCLTEREAEFIKESKKATFLLSYLKEMGHEISYPYWRTFLKAEGPIYSFKIKKVTQVVRDKISQMGYIG